MHRLVEVNCQSTPAAIYLSIYGHMQELSWTNCYNRLNPQHLWTHNNNHKQKTLHTGVCVLWRGLHVTINLSFYLSFSVYAQQNAHIGCVCLIRLSAHCDEAMGCLEVICGPPPSASTAHPTSSEWIKNKHADLFHSGYTEPSELWYRGNRRLKDASILAFLNATAENVNTYIGCMFT